MDGLEDVPELNYWKDWDELNDDEFTTPRLDSWTLASSSCESLDEAEKLIDRCYENKKEEAYRWKYKIIKRVVIETEQELYVYTWDAVAKALSEGKS